jgi:FixJ family two-component response regulator
MTRGLKTELDMIRARVVTLRERQVFALVIRGDTNKQVANALGCTVRISKPIATR